VTRVLVTGAAGFIGSHLVEALAARGDEVVGVDNFDPFYPRAIKERNLREIGDRPGFTFHELDMVDVDALAPHLTRDTVLVHLAAKAGVRPSIADVVGYARVNVAGTAAVMEAARRAGLSRVVFGSSSSVYGDTTPIPFREDATAMTPVSPYAATKRAGELLLEALAPLHRFRVASLRFFTVYGARQRPDLAIHSFARRLAQGQALTLYGDGSQARDYTYFTDIVQGVLAAVDWTATAPVGVDITTAGVADVLSVPVVALVGRTGGGFAVEVVRADGRRELVGVELGLFDTGGGRVQVEGELAEGDQVAVPTP